MPARLVVVSADAGSADVLMVGEPLRTGMGDDGPGLCCAGVVGGCFAGEWHARAAVYADRHGAGHGDPLAAAVRGAVVEDGVVLGGPVVPDREIPDPPLPAGGVLRTGDVVLQDPDQFPRSLRPETVDGPRETAEEQR